MEKLSLGVAATATATCDCNHETLVEHMEVKLTKVTGGAQWNKALAPITLTSNFSAMNAQSNIQSALINGIDRASQHADVILVNMGLWWMCAPLAPLAAEKHAMSVSAIGCCRAGALLYTSGEYATSCFSERSNNKSQHASFPFAGSTCGMRCKETSLLPGRTHKKLAWTLCLSSAA